MAGTYDPMPNDGKGVGTNTDNTGSWGGWLRGAVGDIDDRIPLDVYVAKTGSDANPGTLASPLLTVGAAVTKAYVANADGRSSRIIGDGGIYREALTLAAGGTTAPMEIRNLVLSGSDDLSGSGWTSTGANRIYTRAWVNNWGVQAWPDSAWSAAAASRGWTDEVRRRELVFVDGYWLRQVLLQATLTSYDGAYWVDETNDLLYVRMPAGTDATLSGGGFTRAKVEVGIRQQAIYADTRSNLTLRNITFERYAAPMQKSAVDLDTCTNVLVENCTIQQNNWSALSLDTCTGTRVRSCHLDRNGVAGIYAYRATDTVVEDCTNNWNNWTRGYWAGYSNWEDGMKFYQCRTVKIRNTKANDNNAPGFWFDTDNKNVLLEDSEASRNKQSGVFFELSQGPAVVQRVRVTDNFRGFTFRSSRNIQVRDCWSLRNRVEFSWQVDVASITEWDTAVVVTLGAGNFSVTGNLVWVGNTPVDNYLTSVFNMTDAEWTTLKAASFWDRNTYFSEARVSPFGIRTNTAAQTFTNFAGWKTNLGGTNDANSTYADTAPTDPRLLP